MTIVQAYVGIQPWFYQSVTSSAPQSFVLMLTCKSCNHQIPCSLVIHQIDHAVSLIHDGWLMHTPSDWLCGCSLTTRRVSTIKGARIGKSCLTDYLSGLHFFMAIFQHNPTIIPLQSHCNSIVHIYIYIIYIHIVSLNSIKSPLHHHEIPSNHPWTLASAWTISSESQSYPIKHH